MALSVFLAKFLGIYLIVVYILCMARKKEMMSGIKELSTRSPLQMLSGFISLPGGLAILVGHPVWVFGWPLVVTLLGLLMVAKGVLRIGYPTLSAKWANAIIQNEKWWSWLMLLNLIIGVFLTLHGFMN